MVGTFLFGMAAMALLTAALVLLALKVFRRGALLFEDVPGFYSHVLDGDVGRLIRDIQRDAREDEGAAYASATAHSDDPLTHSVSCTVGKKASGNLLLLSGGGQWGAFGAGLFARLAQKDPQYLALPDVAVITGISTGSLQAMLLMVALDGAADIELRRLAIRQLVWGYSPAHEREVVANTRLIGVPLYGSAAGTAPLRKRILEALRPSGDDRLIAAIATSTISGYVGFVEGASGLFRYADIGALARGASSPAAAAEALAAATMASSAMPVFHQPLRIGADGTAPRTHYDGGVRRSVFFERAMQAIDRAVRDDIAANPPASGTSFAAAYANRAPTVYVVRNGPTVRKEEADANHKSGPLTHGQRGYDLLVNEAEISAIAALRLANSFGHILLTTADKYDTFPHQTGENFKSADEMFKPAFMTCLRELGEWKADRPGGAWWPLATLEDHPCP